MRSGSAGIVTRTPSSSVIVTGKDPAAPEIDGEGERREPDETPPHATASRPNARSAGSTRRTHDPSGRIRVSFRAKDDPCAPSRQVS
jgi:hypothetical protein